MSRYGVMIFAIVSVVPGSPKEPNARTARSWSWRLRPLVICRSWFWISSIWELRHLSICIFRTFGFASASNGHCIAVRFVSDTHAAWRTVQSGSLIASISGCIWFLSPHHASDIAASRRTFWLLSFRAVTSASAAEYALR